MNLTKTTIVAAIAATCAVSASASADTIDMSFTGKFTLTDAAGVVSINQDATNSTDYGFRTDVSGTATFDTVTGAGSGSIDAFSFYGGGLATTTVSFQAIGDGTGNPGTLIAGIMSFDWNDSFDIPITAIFDAAGLFGSIGAVGSTWTVTTGATSQTSDYTIPSPFGTFVGVLGDGPMVMTNYNTAGTTLGNLFPLVDDGIAGSPMTTPPILDFNAGFDFTSITATNVPQVPVPAAAWLFGSGLLGLVGVARRRQS